MDIKCLHPTVLLNPAAVKKSVGFDRIYIRNKCVCWIMELFLLEQSKFMPKKYGIIPDDVESCYLLNSSTGETIPLYIVVPCGSCLICRKRKASALATRAIMETETCGSAPLFITFTYNDTNLPINDQGYQTLSKLDLQLFFKRLRSLLDANCIEHNLRYLACGEYGSKTKRPHYHVLLWNFPVERFENFLKVQAFIQKAWSRYLLDPQGRRIPYRTSCANCPFKTYACAGDCSDHSGSCTAPMLHSLNGSVIYRRLPIGQIKILPSNAGAPAYITKYMVKGSNAPHSSCEDPFRTSSTRNGGIGSAYIKAHRDEILSDPGLEALPVVDKVTGSGRTFYMPIDSWVKNTLIPSPSSCLKAKEYETVREFVNTYILFEQSAQQLYRLYPMDRYVDGELQYYTDTFVDPKTRSLWSKCVDHVREYMPPVVGNINIGNWMKDRELFNEYMYTLTTRLDNLSRKILEIDISPTYFCDREKYLERRLQFFKNKYGNKKTNLECLAENIALSIERSRWKEYF